MIVPMKKVSIVVMDKTRVESLARLRDLGVVHLEKKNVSSGELTALLDRKSKVENALGLLRPYEVPKNKGAPVPAEPPRRRASDRRAGNEPYSADSVNPPPDLVKQALDLGEERKSLQEGALALAKERSRIEKWGNFNPADLAFLEERGIRIFLYEMAPRNFAALPAETRMIVLGQEGALTYFAVFDDEIKGEAPFELPSVSLSEIDRKIENIKRDIQSIETRLAELALKKSLFEEEQRSLLQQIEFETARAGMELPEGDAPAEHALSWITGFVPQESLGSLKRGAAENGWALLSADPGPDDMPPTLLRNNRFARLINPLTDFLEVTPGYHEVDISGWFLFFFCIFFGMIFGDAGYGALLLLGSLAGIIKTVKKGVPPILKLLVLLGLSNFVWGVLTCSWFGIEDVNALPALLRDLSLPLISNVTAAASPRDSSIVQQNLMIFCFSLALLQLSIGHILAIIHGRTLKALADLGSIAMLGGMYCIVLSLIASNEYRSIPLFPPAVYIFAGGFFFNFLFANYEGSIGRSALESLKNIISVILGIANVFSDLMSYIRLWAVGLAGAAIAGTVNAMAGPLLGHFILFVLGVLLLVFGHGLNLVLNMLSVLVHGVRLNTLEFSGHVGLTWAGYAYRPFAKRAIRSRE
jgi:V/A-type H+-transporting ATPase subunit I